MMSAGEQVTPVLAATPSAGGGDRGSNSPSDFGQPTPHPSAMELRTADKVDSSAGEALAVGDVLQKLQKSSLRPFEFRERLREMQKKQLETTTGRIATSNSLRGMERLLAIEVHRNEIEYQQTMHMQREERRKQIRDFPSKGASGGANDSFAESSQAAPERHLDDRFDDFMWRLYLWRLYVIAAVEMLVAKWTDSFYTQFMIGILGVLDAALYVVLTYNNDKSSSGSNSKLGWTVYAYGFSTAYYCVDFLCFSLDAEDGPLTYVLSVQGLLDLVAVIEGTAELLVNQNTVFLRIFKLFKVLRIVKMMRLTKINESTTKAHEEDSVGAEMTKLLVFTVIILFVFSSLIHAVENPNNVWRAVFDLEDSDAEMVIDNKAVDSDEAFHWHDAFYFMVVTFTTVGYGDVYPARPLSRLLIVGIIAFSFVFIPWQSSNLLAAFLNQDSYGGSYKGSNHIILCLQEGFEPHRVMYLLDEMVQSGDDSDRVLLLCPASPSADLAVLLSRFYPRIQYLNGSATVYQDLRRAKFSAARSVLILACPTLSSELDDKRVFLSCVALCTDIDAERRVVAQCRKRKTKTTLVSMGIESVIYLEDVKMAMLGVGLIVPGFLAFAANLLKSEPHVKLSGEWSLDYFKGAGHEIYIFPVSEQIVKMRFPPTFREFSAAVYEYNQSVLLGIMSTPDENDVDYGVTKGFGLDRDGSFRVHGTQKTTRGVCLVNPTDHLINQPMVLFIMGKDKAAALSAILSAEGFILADSKRLLHDSVSTFAKAHEGHIRKVERKPTKKTKEHVYVDRHSRYSSQQAREATAGAPEPSDQEGGGGGEITGHLDFGTTVDGTIGDEYDHATLDSMVEELSQVLRKADELLKDVDGNMHAMGSASEPASPSIQMSEKDVAGGEISAASAALIARDALNNARSFADSARTQLHIAGDIVREHGRDGTLGRKKADGEGRNGSDPKPCTVRLIVHLTAAERKATLNGHLMICMRNADENKAFYLIRTIRLLSKAPVVVCMPDRKVFDQLLHRLELDHRGFSNAVLFYESSFVDREGLVACHAEGAKAVLLMMGDTAAQGIFQQQSIDCDVLMEGHQLRAYLASRQALTRVHAIFEFFHEQSIVSIRGHYRDYTSVERRDAKTGEVVPPKKGGNARRSIVDRDGDLVMSSENIQGLMKEKNQHLSKGVKKLAYRGSYIGVSRFDGITQSAKSRLLSRERGKTLEDEGSRGGRRSKMHKVSVADSHGRPLFAAGQAFVASMLDMLTIQALHECQELCFWHKVMGIEPVVSLAGRSSNGGDDEGAAAGGGVSSGQPPLQIQAIELPLEFVGLTYGYLFREIMGATDVAVGLYRPQGHKGAAMRYMLNNPPPSTKLVKGDFALVIKSSNETLPMTALQRQHHESLEKDMAMRNVPGGIQRRIHRGLSARVRESPGGIGAGQDGEHASKA